MQDGGEKRTQRITKRRKLNRKINTRLHDISVDIKWIKKDGLQCSTDFVDGI